MIRRIVQKLGDFLFHQKLVFYGCEMKFCLQICFFCYFLLPLFAVYDGIYSLHFRFHFFVVSDHFSHISLRIIFAYVLTF